MRDAHSRMIRMERSDPADSNFLLFSLIAQELIAIIFAFYSFRQGEMALVIFYMSAATVLSVAMGVFYIYQRHDVARFLLASTLVVGFFFLLIGTSDETSLMWCLTIVPVLVGAFGNRQSLFLLIAVFAASIWILISDAVPFVTRQYSDIMIMRFLSSYAILATFSVAMDNSLFNSLKNYKILSSEVQETAHRDALTNLPNRHNMEGQLKQHQLVNGIFSVVLADLDNFKWINDRYGHNVGDDIIQTSGQLLNSELRDEDTVGRWSGNQFILLLPNASEEETVKIAERLRVKIANLDIKVQGDQLRLSISMGVASVEKCAGLDDLISCAENGVYQAKHMGRNMVVVG